MDDMIIDQSRYEQAAVASEAEDVVRLMTIHKAKGLEFPVVFLPDLNAERKGRQSRLLNRTDWRLTYKLRADEDDNAEAPVSWRIARRLEDAEQHREDIRKLYVAVTRHRDHLVFVAADWRTKDGKTFKAKDSYLAMLDEALGIRSAVDAGHEQIPYAGGNYHLAVRRVSPGESPRGRREKFPTEKLTALAGGGEAAAKALEKDTAKAGPSALVGPLDAAAGRAELAVTALSDFELCPMLYHCRHELRIPALPAGAAMQADADDRRDKTPATDPLAFGTAVHRCMELLDFASPQPADVLARAAVGDIATDAPVDADALADQLAPMLESFLRHELMAELRTATKVYRELDFVMALGATSLRGQIDLAYEDAGGAWHVVDYKSDRLSADEAAEHSQRYELQLLLYAAAAARRLPEPPADAKLFFLRPATVYTFGTRLERLAAAEARAEKLARALIQSRRAGKFARNESPRCRFCPYASLCLPDRHMCYKIEISSGE